MKKNALIVLLAINAIILLNCEATSSRPRRTGTSDEIYSKELIFSNTVNILSQMEDSYLYVPYSFDTNDILVPMSKVTTNEEYTNSMYLLLEKGPSKAWPGGPGNNRYGVLYRDVDKALNHKISKLTNEMQKYNITNISFTSTNHHEALLFIDVQVDETNFSLTFDLGDMYTGTTSKTTAFWAK